MSSYKKELILIVSNIMTNNKKTERNEHGLIRMSASAREHMNFGSPELEISNKTTKCNLIVFQAFSEDIKQSRASGWTSEQIKRIGFVTRDTFQKFYKGKESVLLSDVLIGLPEEEKKEKSVANILIGADPEFLLFDNSDNIINANTLMPKEGLIGSDGAMVEIRPKPELCPTSLVQNMFSIFKDAAEHGSIKDLIWKASIYYKNAQRDYPVGGHIHFGNPPWINKIAGSGSRDTLFAVFNKIIDELLAIPLIKLDGDELGRLRRSECQMAMGNKGYGYFGEWRKCDGRLEHRTLSGLWLMHPVLAESVIGTAKAIAEEMHNIVIDNACEYKMFKHPDINLNDFTRLYRPEFNDWESIGLTSQMECTKPSSFMATMLNSSKAKNITKKFLTGWHEKLKRLTTYTKYDKYINKLYEILLLPRNSIEKVGFDIKKNWLEKTNFPT